MSLPQSRRSGIIRLIVMSGLSILLVGLIYHFTQDLAATRQSYLSQRASGSWQRQRPFWNMTRQATSSTLAIDQIQGWMTFGYLNQTFRLPVDYLRNSLSIQDPRYPKISIRHYVKENQLDMTVTLEKIKTSLRAFFATSSTPSLP